MVELAPFLYSRGKYTHCSLEIIILGKFKRILFPLKPSDNHWFSDDFTGNRKQLFA